MNVLGRSTEESSLIAGCRLTKFSWWKCCVPMSTIKRGACALGITCPSLSKSSVVSLCCFPHAKHKSVNNITRFPVKILWSSQSGYRAFWIISDDHSPKVPVSYGRKTLAWEDSVGAISNVITFLSNGIMWMLADIDFNATIASPINVSSAGCGDGYPKDY